MPNQGRTKANEPPLSKEDIYLAIHERLLLRGPKYKTFETQEDLNAWMANRR